MPSLSQIHSEPRCTRIDTQGLVCSLHERCWREVASFRLNLQASRCAKLGSALSLQP